MNKKERIKRYITTMIKTEKWPKESKTSSENQLAIKFECSRLTARQALRECVQAGLLISRQGRGYFVSLSTLKQTSNKNIKTQFTEGIAHFSTKEKKIFKELSDQFESFISNRYVISLYKTYLDKENKSYKVLKSYLFNDENKYDADLISNSISAYFDFKKIVPCKKKFICITERVPDIIMLKLESKSSEKIPTEYSILFNERNEIVECSISYTKPDSFRLEGVSDLM